MLGVGRVTGEFSRNTTYVVNEAEGLGESLRELKVSASSFVNLLNSTRSYPQTGPSSSLDEVLHGNYLYQCIFL